MLGVFGNVRPIAYESVWRSLRLDHLRAHAALRRVLPSVAIVKDWRALAALFRDVRSVIGIAVFAIFGIVLCQMSYLNVIHYTSAGVGTTLEQLGLVLIMLWTCLRKHRLPNVREVLGLVLALFGLVLIATQGDVSRLAVSQEGLFWGMMSAVLWRCTRLCR
mgnify:CR=1 FL=1